MAGSVNKVILVGNLGRDPEIRATQDSMRIAQLSVATSETWKDKATGEKKEKTEWHRVVIFNERLADVAEKYLSKGDKVYLEGSLQTRKWTDKDDVERYTTEIVLTKFRGELVMLETSGRDDREDPAPVNPMRAGPTGRPIGGAGRDDLDDEIPF